MQLLDLFSGIGGFRLAAEMAGWEFEHEYHSEISEYALRVYQRHYPDSVGLGDIRGIDGRDLRARHSGPWVVCGGFPCQGISAAGRRKGLEDPRSGLWSEYRRVVEELDPDLVLIENSPHLRSRGLEVVLGDLASIGFDSWWSPISAEAVGAAHRRSRLWVVAWPSREGPAADPGLPLLGSDLGLLRQLACGRDLGDGAEPARPLAGDRAWADWQGERTRRYLEGRPVVRRVGDGLSAGVDPLWGDWRRRGQCVGNAIVPQVAAFLFRMIEHAGLKPTEQGG